MRGVSRRVSRAASLVAVLVVLTASGAWAGETQTPPTDPPQARLGPPVGISAQARLNPPVGASLFDTFLLWLQSRLSVPHG
jgi:hypothetical protein